MNHFFHFSLRKFIWIVLVVSLPLLSINMQQKAQQDIWVAKPFVAMSSFSDSVVHGFTEGVAETVGLYMNLIGVKAQNNLLKSTNASLLAKLQVMKDLESENNRLRKLLDFRERTKMELKAAKVIGRDLIMDHSSITIDKGSADGLSSGQAVISQEGVVGYTFKVGPSTSHVMLITDRYAVVDGILERSRAHGIVEGKSKNLGQLKYVEKTADVQVGDVVITSGLDNLFPKGYPLAKVIAVEKSGFSISQKIDLAPIVSPGELEEVFVIFNANNLDLTNFESAGTTQ